MSDLKKELREYICDNLCKYPCVCRGEEHLMEMCEECQVEEYLEQLKVGGADEEIQPYEVKINLERVLEVTDLVAYSLQQFKTFRKICDRYIEKTEETLKKWGSEQNESNLSNRNAE